MAHRNALAIVLKPSDILALMGLEGATFKAVTWSPQNDRVLVYLEGADWMPYSGEGYEVYHATLDEAKRLASPEYQAMLADLDS